MRISLESSGEALELPADFQIELSRVNPFFSEHGEHSVPITLPASPRNSRLLGFAEDVTVYSRAEYKVVVEDDGFYYPGTMRLLSASAADGIEATILLNLGLLYSKLRSDKLVQVVKAQYEPIDLKTVDRAIGYLKELCRRVRNGDEDIFDCFPVMADKLLINEYASTNPNQGIYFSAERDRWIDIGGVNTLLPRGFLLTPFLRLRPLLLRLFAHYGYRIDSFGPLEEAPYRDMVLLNYNYDTIVNARLLPVQLTPDCTCSELLQSIESKFIARWIVNEASNRVSLVTLQELLSRTPRDISARVVSPLKLSFPESYRYLSMKSQSYVQPVFKDGADVADYERPENLTNTLANSRGLSLDEETGILYRFLLTKVCGWNLLAAGNLVTDFTGSGKGLSEEAVSAPDTVPALQRPIKPTAWADRAYLQLGQGRWLNSFARVGGKAKMDDEKTGELPIMLAIPTSGFGSMRQGGLIDASSGRSLLYNGKGGFYDRYARDYDRLLRSALVETECELQLRQEEKMNLSAVGRLKLADALWLPESINYSTRALSLHSVKLRSLRSLSSVLYTEPIDGVDFATLPRHTWQLGYIVNYSNEPNYLDGFLDEMTPIDEAGFRPIRTALGAAGSGAGAVDPGDPEGIDYYHWGQLINLVLPDWQARGDRVIDAPTPAEIAATSQVQCIYVKVYDTGDNPMPQPTPDDPSYILRGKYLVIWICVKPVRLPLTERIP